MNLNKERHTTAPKKTWGGQRFQLGSFFVAIFVTGGQVRASKAPRFLAAKRYASIDEPMKYKLLIFAFSFISLKSIGQDVPQVLANTDLVDRQQSYVYNTFRDDYEILVSFTSDCYWPNKQEYYLVGKKNSQWESMKVVIEYKDRTKTADNIKRIKKKRLKTKKEELKNLFSSWTDIGFWTLENDSLNVNEKQISPDESIMIMITDGCTDTFEIIQDGSYRIMYSYLPDSFQKEIPVKQREQFIIARNKFLKIIKNK